MTLQQLLDDNFNQSIKIELLDRSKKILFNGVIFRENGSSNPKYHSDLNYYLPIDIWYWRVWAGESSYNLEIVLDYEEIGHAK